MLYTETVFRKSTLSSEFIMASVQPLKDIFEDEIRMTLKNQTPRVIKIKAMRKTKPEISQEKYQETPF